MASEERRPLLISLEGNIGSGKSTLLRLIQQRLKPGPEVILEPVPEWQAVGPGQSNLLDCFYKNIDRWGFPFQIFTLFTRLEKWAALIRPGKTYLSERSIDCDMHVFSQKMLELGLMDPQQRDMYVHLYHGFKRLFPYSQPQAVIYLRTPPSVCHERLKRRNRSEQAGVELDYLNDLHSLHETWLTGQSECRPVLCVDGSLNFASNEDAMKSVADSISKFIASLSP